MKNQTAVEWQFDELQKLERNYKNEVLDGWEYTRGKYQIFEQAKAMEKEQIINSNKHGFTEGTCFGATTIYKFETPEQYYNETFIK